MGPGEAQGVKLSVVDSLGDDLGKAKMNAIGGIAKVMCIDMMTKSVGPSILAVNIKLIGMRKSG